MSANTPTTTSKAADNETPAQDPKKPLVFAPGVVGTFEHVVEQRIELLESLLGQERWEYQRVNTLKVIEMYKSGELTIPCSHEVWLANGEVINGPPKKAVPGVCYISEGIKRPAMQMTQASLIPSQDSVSYH
jgi:hypothetical protein